MNDELKQWLRIFKFGMPSVVSYAFILSGMGIMITQFDINPIIGFQGLSFALLGVCIFYMISTIRLGNKLKQDAKEFRIVVANLNEVIDGINNTR